MPTKYGELTILYNQEETSVFTSFLMWLECEGKPPKNSKYVFLFDDGEICEYDDTCKDFNYKFYISSLSEMPLYFEKKIKHKENRIRIYFYFYKHPIKDNNNNNLSLDFKTLFNSYSKYSVKISIASHYNSIYYCYKGSSKPEIFGIMRIKSNEYMPRFQFAYDSDEFTKEEIVYLIHSIFNHSNLQNG